MLKKDFSEKVKKYLSQIYSDNLNTKQINNFLNIKSIFNKEIKKDEKDLWSENDFLLITYADSVLNPTKNLITLSQFLKNIVKNLILYIFFLFSIFVR